MGTVNQGPATRRPTMVTVAAVVLALKAALGVWASYALLSASRTHHRCFLGGTVTSRHTGLGVLMFVLAAASVVVVAALALMRQRARMAAFALEGVGIILALSRLGTRPGSSLVSLVLSAVIIGSLLSPSVSAAFGRQ
jgi:hypothetical protein